MYGVCFTCLGRLHSYSSFEQREIKYFRLINSSPLTDCLQPLSHRCNVASLALFYRYFHANCSSDLSKISDWGKANLVLFNASKTQLLHLSTRHNLPKNYPFFFNATQLSPSTLNILGLSYTSNLNWKLHISSLDKTASMNLGVLSRLRQFYSPPQLYTRASSAHVWSMLHMFGEAPLIYLY